MPNANGQFQGLTLIRSGAYYADNVSNLNVGQNPGTPPLIFLGNGYGVKPQTPVTFTDGSQLLTALRGGPCSGFVQFLTNPSNQLNGAGQITYINVSENTQSVYCASGGSPASGVINFKSANYGLPSNQLQVAIAAGTIAGKNVSLLDGYSNTSVPPGINLGAPFKLAYTGTATGVTYTVVVSGGVATALSTSSPNAGESVNISLSPANYATISQLVGYLNGTGFYNAYVLSQGDLPSSNLDSASGVALASGLAGVNQYVTVTATLGDIVWWVNQHANSLATASIVSGITSSSGVAPTNIPFTFFTGATSVGPTTSDYASGFNLALGIPGWTVFCDSNASGVVSLGTQHATTASAANVGRWRRFFSGSSIGDSISTATQTAQNQNSITTCYVYPGIYRNDPNSGVNTLYGGLYAAAAACAMATGNPIPTPLTNKALISNGVEVVLTDAQINQLQQAGVMCIAVSTQTGLPTIMRDFTTWQQDSNPENILTQQVACRWELAYLIQSALQPFAGTVASNLTETQILQACVATLNNAEYSQGNPNGVINSWDQTSLVVQYNATTLTASCSVNVALVGQNVFITMLVQALPTNLTVTTGQFGQTGGLPA